MSPERAAAAAQMAAKGGKADAAAAVPPPPPPAAEVIGQPLLKDFRCEESGTIRPFSGTITEFHDTEKWCADREVALHWAGRAVRVQKNPSFCCTP